MDNWQKSKYYQARIQGTNTWIRLLKFDPLKDCYLCRSGEKQSVYFTDELADFCW